VSEGINTVYKTLTSQGKRRYTLKVKAPILMKKPAPLSAGFSYHILLIYQDYD
jgi:hypothetical protein